MENLPIKTFDVLSFTGLIALLPFLMEGLKMLSKSFFSGKENWVTVVLAFGIGVPVKVCTPLAYNGLTGPMGWIVTIIGLFLTSIAAMTVHDKVLAGMFGWQKSDGGPTNAPTGAAGAAGSPPPGNSGRTLLSLIVAVFALTLCVSAMSCSHVDRQTLATGVEAETRQIFVEYRKYVIDGQPLPKFTEDDKELRRDQLSKIQNLLDQGKH